MSTFDTVNYILYDKSKKELDNELLSEFTPFLVSKTFSFYDGGVHINYVNDTLNIYGNIFETSEETFKFFENVIPKLKRKKLEYIKKPKKPDEKTELLPVPEFSSRREQELLTRNGE